MGLQEELNEKVQELVTANEGFAEQLTAIRDSIAEEKAQIDILVANNPTVDFSGLNAAIARTKELVASSETVDEEVGDVYKPGDE